MRLTPETNRNRNNFVELYRECVKPVLFKICGIVDQLSNIPGVETDQTSRIENINMRSAIKKVSLPSTIFEVCPIGEEVAETIGYRTAVGRLGKPKTWHQGVNSIYLLSKTPLGDEGSSKYAIGGATYSQLDIFKATGIETVNMPSDDNPESWILFMAQQDIISGKMVELTQKTLEMVQ